MSAPDLGPESGTDLGGAQGADLPGAPERVRLGELYGEVPDGVAPLGAGGAAGDGVGSGAASEAALAPAMVRVVRGDPDAVELAALIAGLTAAAAAGVEEVEEEVVRHRWMDRSHALRGGERGLPARSADAWRWSLHP